MDTKAVIFGKNMEVSDRVNDYVIKKINKIERFLSDIDDIRIDLAYLKSARNAADRYVAQITIRGKGYILRTEERAEDIFAAFDISLDKMVRQIDRFKGKRREARGDGTSVAETIPSTEAGEADEDTEKRPIIARRKKFHMVPMDEMEALEQMQLLGHEEFFVFYNVATSSVNVLYKRNDGTYGLIESEIA
ncbi:ribosome hibernation-promoting factor, HPF/YfiA family [Flexilinea flocculi]|jgi:putative sigma-54 modulation protein|uniref:Ribosome hibernation promoting factor n=1 Tax=Flexilinea flocculi TaxID=1678840 RepID=A0A0K8PBA3_9CHLR|nr:ribosome-associated translation inhibitor RaiA [Flexilinea flocculi]NMB94568.1 ribosome-associated translation inhibitor RaiA [Flexilinea flocculi]GAP39921.1 ribosomal subunit interface protein [Flexilinea flocculi]